MEMCRRRDRNRVDLAVEQFLDIRYGGAVQCTGNEFGLLSIGIRDTDQLNARQTGEHASMVAAHYAHAHDAYTQRTLRACYCSLHHVSIVPHAPTSAAYPLARQGAAGDHPLDTEVNTFSFKALQGKKLPARKLRDLHLFGGARSRNREPQAGCDGVVTEGFYRDQ